MRRFDGPNPVTEDINSTLFIIKKDDNHIYILMLEICWLLIVSYTESRGRFYLDLDLSGLLSVPSHAVSFF